MKNSLNFIKNFGVAIVRYNWNQPMRYYAISTLCLFILVPIFIISKEHMYVNLINASLIFAIPGLLLEYYKYFQENKEKFWYKVLTTGVISSFIGYVLFNIIYEFSSSQAEKAIFYITGLDSAFFPHATHILTYLNLVPLSIETIIVALTVPIIIRMSVWLFICSLIPIFDIVLFPFNLFFPENKVNISLKKLEGKSTAIFGSMLGIIGIMFIFVTLSTPITFKSPFARILSVAILANTDYRENEYYKGKHCYNLAPADRFVALGDNTISVLHLKKGLNYEFEIMQCQNGNFLVAKK